jgi:hypothetical protein
MLDLPCTATALAHLLGHAAKLQAAGRAVAEGNDRAARVASRTRWKPLAGGAGGAQSEHLNEAYAGSWVMLSVNRAGGAGGGTKGSSDKLSFESEGW